MAAELLRASTGGIARIGKVFNIAAIAAAVCMIRADDPLNFSYTAAQALSPLFHVPTF